MESRLVAVVVNCVMTKNKERIALSMFYNIYSSRSLIFIELKIHSLSMREWNESDDDIVTLSRD